MRHKTPGTTKARRIIAFVKRARNLHDKITRKGGVGKDYKLFRTSILKLEDEIRDAGLGEYPGIMEYCEELMNTLERKHQQKEK